VVVLAQCLRFIENGERFSPKDDRVTGNSVSELIHPLGFTGFGVDDFQSADKRKSSILEWFEQNWLKEDANVIFLNVKSITRLMNECYNDLRKKFPQLSIQRHIVTFQSSRSNKKISWSTNIFTPLYHLSPEQKTMPLWVDKSVWKLFLESEYEFDQRDFHKPIKKHQMILKKNLYTAIEKTKTIGQLNYETVTTKAVMTKPQTEHEKKANEFDQRQELSKKRK
jgi:hypothetical protein